MTVPGPLPPRPAETPALDELRAAVAALPDATLVGDIDAADHAVRFEAVHDALVAVLADVDGTCAPWPGRPRAGCASTPSWSGAGSRARGSTRPASSPTGG